MSKPSKRGQCGKNALPKRSQTDGEKKRVAHHMDAVRKHWEALLLLNKWRPLP